MGFVQAFSVHKGPITSRRFLMSIIRNAVLSGVALLGCIATTVSLAQPPGGGGQFTPTPEMRAKFAALQKYFDQHKNARQVSTTLQQIEQMEKQDPSLALTKP